ncbi:HYR domain-containing protein [uncultured Draconibacterium sp.]|uniref:HYR domain-containing protein n=1 Tax=uncultured Draconibacterium sp. TaxID=1573823 RepID=UPI0037498C73
MLVFLFAGIFLINMEMNSAECVNAITMPESIRPTSVVSEAVFFPLLPFKNITYSSISYPRDIIQETDKNQCSALIKTGLNIDDPQHNLQSLSWEMTGATSDRSPNSGINQIDVYLFNKGSTRIIYRGISVNNNPVIHEFTVTVVDNQVPVMVAPPTAEVICNHPVPEAFINIDGFIQAGGELSDNCEIDRASFAFVSESRSGSVCPFTITRTYQVQDNSGNIAEIDHHIRVKEEVVVLKSGQADYTAISGNWSSTATWGGALPNSGDNIIIPSGVTVTVDITTAVCNTINIESGGTLIISGSNKLTVYGSWNNSGSFDAGTDGTVEFTGTNNAEITGATTFENLIVSKGSLSTSLLINGNVNVSGGGGLSLSGGLISIPGTGSLSLDFSAGLTIPSTAGFDVIGGTLTTGNFSITNNGLIRVNSGTAEFGTSAGNTVHTQVDGAFIVNGGIVDISGRLENTAGGTLTPPGVNSGISISAGTVTLATAGNGLSSVGSLNVTANGDFRFTGGTIVFQNPSTATTELDLGIIGGAGTKLLSGGTFQLGNASTPNNSTFVLDTEIPLSNLSTGNNADLVLNGDLAVSGSISLDANSSIELNGYTLERAISTGGTYSFPIADDAGNPVSVTITISGGFDGDESIEITTSNIKHPDNESDNHYLNQYWEVGLNGITNPNYSISAQYQNADISGTENEIAAGIWDGSSWTKFGAAGGGTILASNVSGTTIWFTGITLDDPTVEINGGNTTENICSGLSVALSANVTGDNPITYSWTSTPAGFTSTSSSVNVNPLVNTTYTLTITDGNGFTATDDIQVVVDPQPTASTNGGATICENSSYTLGAGEANASNGNILWTENGFGAITAGANTLTPTYTAASGDAGNVVTLTMTVTSDNACSPQAAVAVYAINVDPLPTASAGGSETICAGSSTTVSGASASNGTILWTHNGLGALSSDGTLAPTYTSSAGDAGNDVMLTLTVTSTNDCAPATSTDIFTVTVREQLSPSTISTAQDICYNGVPQSLVGTAATGGSGSYSYQWQSSPDGTGSWTNVGTNSLVYSPPALTATTFYRLEVSDLCGTEYSNVVEVNVAPELTASDAATAILCNGGSATVTLSGNGGTPPYEYIFNGVPDADGVISNVTAGSYNWSVTDARNCGPVTGTINITQPTAVSASIAITNEIDCNGQTGEVTITASGGATPYEYTFNGVTQSSNVFTGILAGNNLTWSVRDANGCEFITGSPVNMVAPDALSASATPTHLQCYNDNSGSIELTVTGGTMPYSFAWDNGAGNVEDPSGLAANSYSVTITDAKGCTTAAIATVNQPAELTASVDATPILCNGEIANIQINAGGGTPPYVYTFDGNANGTGTFAGILAASGIAWQVEDASGCIVSDTYDLVQPTEIVISAISVVDDEICEGEDIELSSAASGGTGGLTYTWEYPDGTIVNNAQNPTILNTDVSYDGTFTLIVTDANNCSKDTTMDVIVHPSPTVNSIADIEDCHDVAIGEISISGNNADDFSWTIDIDSIWDIASSGNGNIPAFTTNNMGNEPVTATVTVTPLYTGQGCSGVAESFTIIVNPIPEITVTNNTPILCDNGITSIVLSSNVSGTTFNWSGDDGSSGTGNIIEESISGGVTYSITPISPDGCVGDDGTTSVAVISTAYDLEVNPEAIPATSYCQGEDFSFDFRASSGGAGSILNYTFQRWWGSDWDEIEWVTQFMWTVDNPNVAINTNGGPIGNGTVSNPDALNNLTIPLINNTDVVQTATISVTPWSYSRERSCEWRFWGGTNCSSWSSWSSQCAGDAYEITITVQPFAIECSGDYDLFVDPGECNATITPDAPTISCDPGTTLTWTMTGDATDSGNGNISNYDFPTGTTTVTYRATENANPSNFRECSFNVTVEDNEAPAISNCPADINQTMSSVVCGDTVVFSEPVFTDNCDGIITATRTDGTGLNSGDVFPEGITTLTWHAVDAAGNDTTCSFDVTILSDGSGPDITCVGNQAECAPYNSTYLKTGTDWDAIATDNCPGVISLNYNLSGASSGTGSSLNNVQFSIGTTTVEWTATDAQGNSSNCSFEVIISEEPGFAQNPVDVSACLNGSATFTASAAGVPAPTYQWRFEGTDIPGETGATLIVNNIQAIDAGNYDVVASSSCGTAISTNAVLSVSSPPEITTQPASQTDCLGESVEFTVAAIGGETPYSYAWQMRPTSSDAWGDAAMVSNIVTTDDVMVVTNIGDSNNPDHAEYRVIVTDVCGNSDTSSVAAITVNTILNALVDTTTVCQDGAATFSVLTSGSVPVLYEWFLNSSPVSNNAVFSGTTTQTLTITNAQVSEGGTYSVRVTFNITQPNNNGAGATTCQSLLIDIGELIVDEGPDIVAGISSQTICPGNAIAQIDLSNANGTPGTTYSWTRDNTGVLTGMPDSGSGNTINGVLNSLTPGTMVTTTFEITALANGCPSATTVTVTVGDTTRPTPATCPTDIIVNTDAGLCDATVSYTVPAFDDDCDGLAIPGTLVEGFASGAQFPIGTTTVKYIYTDAAGNVSDTCSFNVTVADNEQPTAICKDVTVQLDATGVVSITPADIDNGSSDGCGLDSLRIDVSSFDCSDIGDNTVSLTAVDLYGNEATCAATVTVQDTVKPVVACRDINAYLDVNGQVSITAAAIDNGSTDNCAIASLNLSATDFTCTDLGSNSVTLTATDDNGNSSTCNAEVNVLDTISPNAICRDITIQLNGSGSASITANDVNNGSSDNCGIDTMFISQYTFDCSETGLNLITLTVVDDNGNSSDCVATVTVEDIEKPVARCRDITIQLDANGLAAIVAADIDNGSTDNCGVPTLSVSPNSFNCTNLGANTVTLTATDGYGNDSTCQAVVTVSDDDYPVEITANVSQTTILCNGEPADITISVSGGVGALTYTFNGVSQPGNTFSGIGAGTYNWSVTDPFGCGDTTGTFEVVEPEPLQALLTSLDASCSSGNDGEIRISASGGSNVFEFSIDGGASWESDTIFTGLSPGFYDVQMRDANVPTCSVVLDAALEIIILDADITLTDISCYGETDGEITLSNPDGGSGAYQFSINGGTTWEDFVSGSYTYINLMADTFDVWIRDANDLTCVIPLDTMLILTEPDSLYALVDSANITCFGANNGTISLLSSAGGTGGYEYSIDGGTNWSSNSNFAGLIPATYDVRMRDANGCEKILNAALILTEPSILTANIDSSNISCNGGNDGEIILSNPTGGYGSYEFSVDGGTNWQTDTAFLNLYAGTYDVRIRDISDPSCFIILNPTLVLTEPPAMNIAAQPTDITNCFASTVQFGVNINGGAGTITYEWQRMRPSESVFTTISAGPNVLNQDTDSLQVLNIGNADSPNGTQYRVVISDNCTVLTSDVVTLLVNEITDVTPDIEDTEICEGQNYSLQVVTSGGAPVSYQWQIDSAGTWENLSNSTIVSGVDTDQLTITGASTAFTGQYRVVVSFPSSGAGCDLSSESFVRNLTVHPLPVVDSNSDIVVCNGGIVSAINFTGTGTSYDWTNTDASIGLAASGTGDITSFTAVNSDTVPVNAEIVVTPRGLYCDGIADTFLITVNPTPEAIAPSGLVFCEAGPTDPYPLSGIPSNVVFDISGGASIGLADATDVSEISSFTPIVGTATITITPKLNGCTGTAVSFDILVVESPTATISGGDTVCQGGLAASLIFESATGRIVEATYTINGADTNTVVIPAYTPVPLPVPTNNSGVFEYELIQVAYISEPYCSNTDVKDTAQIVVIEPPVPTILGPDEICANIEGNVYTTEPGMTDYVWNVSSGATITAGGDLLSNTITITWDTPGSKNVSVRYTDGNLCSATISTIYPVTVNAVPVPTITGSANVCEGEVITYITQSGMTNYLWDISAGGTISAGGALTDNSVTVEWNGAGDQTVSVNYTNGNGCTADSTTLSITEHDVYVNPEPTPSLAGVDTACTGTEHTYTSDAGMTNYIWTVSAGGTIVSGGTFNDNTATIRWNADGAQSISVNYTDTSGCIATADSTLNVWVHLSPVPVINGPGLICAGSANATYRTDPGMTNYNWTVSAGGTITGGANDSIVYVTWNSIGNHTISVDYTNANNCNAITPSVLAVEAVNEVIPTITGVQTVCEGTTGNYTTESGMSDYNWSVIGGAITAGGDPSSNSVTILWDSAGVQTVSVDYLSINGCNSIVTNHSVTVDPMPHPSITGATSACLDTIVYTYTTEPGMTDYQWIYSAGAIVIGGGSSTDDYIEIQWDALGPQSVNVNYTNLNGCRAITASTQNVVVNELTPVTCPGDTTFCVNAGIVNLVEGTPGGGVFSGPGVSGNTFDPMAADVGLHTITYSYTNDSACVSSCTFEIRVDPQPIVLDQYLTICSESAVDINLNQLVPDATFSWIAYDNSGGGASVSGFNDCTSGCDTMITDILVNSSITEPSYNTGTAGTVIYEVTAMHNGCGGTFNIVVTVQPSIIELEHSWNSNFVEDFIEVCAGAQALSSNDLEILHPTRTWGFFNSYGLLTDGDYFDDDNWGVRILYGQSEEGPWVQAPHGEGPFGDGWNDSEGPYQWIVDLAINDRLGYHYFIVELTDPYTGCIKYSNPAILNIVSSLRIEAGGPDFVCTSSSPSPITLDGAYVGGIASTSTGGTWTANVAGGSFSQNFSNPGLATYTPPADFVGEITLTLTSNDPDGSGECVPLTDERIMNVLPPGSFESCLEPATWIESGSPGNNGYLDDNQSPCAINIVGSDNLSGNPGSFGISHCAGAGTLSFDWYFKAPVNKIVWHQEDQQVGSNNGSSSRMYVAPPTNIEVGDLIIVTIHVNDNTGTISDNDGEFIEIRRDTYSGAVTLASFYKIATSADVSRTTDYRFNLSNVSSNDRIYSVRISGADQNQATVIGDNDGIAQYLTYPARDYMNATIPAVSVTNANSMLVSALAINISGSSGDVEYINSPLGSTTMFYEDYETTARVAQELISSTGSAGTQTFSWPSYNSRNRYNMYVAAHSFIINPAIPDVDAANYIIGTTPVMLGNVNGASGSVSVPVSGGENISFAVSTDLNTGGPGELIIYNLDVPNDPPVVSGDTLIEYAECQPVGFDPDTAFTGPTVFDDCDTFSIQTGYPTTTAIISNGCENSQTRTWVYVDDCGLESETFTQRIIWTVMDTINLSCPPSDTLASCSDVADIQVAYNAWKAGFSYTGGCETVFDNLNEFPVLTDLSCGGQLDFTLIVYDACGQVDSCTSHLVIQAAEDLALSCPNDTLLPACTDTAEIRVAYEAWIAGFSYVGGCSTVTTNIDSVPELTDLSCGGEIEFRYVVNLGSPSCPNSIDCYRTFTVEAPVDLHVNVPGDATLPLCSDTASIRAAYDIWVAGFTTTGGCDVQSNIDSIPELPDLTCGGSVSFVFRAWNGEGKCVDSAVDSSSFTVMDPPPLSITCPPDPNLPGCSGALAITAAYNDWVDGFTASGGCDLVTNIDSIPPLGDLLCNGQLVFEFIARSGENVCSAVDTCVATFTIGNADTLAITCPGDTIVEGCSAAEVQTVFDNWIAQFAYTGGCNVNESDLSIYTPPITCGGVVVVNYIVSDECEQTDSCTATFQVNAPELVISVPEDTLLDACSDQLDVDAAFASWISQFGYSGGCNVVATAVDSFTSPNICGGEIVINYSAADVCGQVKTGAAFFAIDFPLLVELNPSFTVPANTSVYSDALCNYDADPTITGYPTDLYDNCTEDSLHISYNDNVVDGSCAGEYIIYRDWTVVDNCGNDTTQQQIINVLDTIPPVIVCPNDTSEFTDPSQCTKTGMDMGTAAATDNCTPEASIIITNDAPVQLPVGTTTVTWTATDDCGNVSFCTQLVTIVDTIPPNIDINGCQDVTETAAPNNCSKVPDTMLDPVYSDDCWPVDSLVLTYSVNGATTASGTGSAAVVEYNVGVSYVTYVVTDPDGLQDSCSFIVTIVDVTPPGIDIGGCVDVSDTAAANNCSKVAAIIADPTYSDNCWPVDSLTLTWTMTGATTGTGNGSVAGESFNVGLTTVQYVVTDPDGNSDSCSFTVRILDITAPGIDIGGCVDVSGTMDANNCYAIPPAITDPIFSDACWPVDSLALSFRIENGAWDTTGVGYVSGLQFPVGTNTVWYIVTDPDGNADSCSFTVEMLRDEIPWTAITCPSDPAPIVLGSTECERAISLDPPVVSDYCVTATYTITNDFNGLSVISDEIFPVGITQVNWTISDNSGNDTICTVYVDISGVQLPTIACPDDVIGTMDASGCYAIPPSIDPPTYSAPCWDTDSLDLSFHIINGVWDTTGVGEVNGLNFPVGTNTVWYIVTDPDGNKDSCDFVVTMQRDEIQWTAITCPSDPAPVTVGPTDCEVFVDVDVPGISDYCATATYTITNDYTGTDNADTLYPIGITPVTWTISDNSGNDTTCIVNVEVIDRLPLLLCPPDTVLQADFNRAYASGITIDLPYFEDNCDSTLTWTVSGATTLSELENDVLANGVNVVHYPDTFNLGTTTITYTFEDGNGNIVECSHNITVLGAPEIECPPDTTIYLDGSEGTCAAAFDPGVADLIRGTPPITWTYTITFPDGSTQTDTYIKDVPDPEPNPLGVLDFPAGVTTIEWRADNISGYDTCSHWIEVIDTIPPSIDASPYEDCVDYIEYAIYNPSNPNPIYHHLDPNLEKSPSPDYSTFYAGSTDLDLTLLTDNCCDSLSMVNNLTWTIDFQATLDPITGATINPAPISGTGQPSAYGADIQLWGDGVDYATLSHTITYRVSDCNGNLSEEIVRTITITPRPEIIKQN